MCTIEEGCFSEEGKFLPMPMPMYINNGEKLVHIKMAEKLPFYAGDLFVMTDRSEVVMDLEKWIGREFRRFQKSNDDSFF
ncbi:hypothetical protein CEXT_45171 [Caerostris extrusa]|uniref:Uncharacterized protein n=1 Tax=Caerostris extrusa TaxID=172846 RepID=A0AAV4URW9_CAEEX|nr:hypothetical protein CEXT_45171 [Caerostris extrusa]